jgi:hypothetical protein
MNRRCLLGHLLLAVAMVTLTGSMARAQFKNLVTRIPSTANTIVMLNVEKMLESPLAQQQDWKSDIKKAYDAGLLRLPPDTQQYVMAAQLDFTSMTPDWEVGVINVSEEHSLAEAAKEKKGTVESIAGRDAVLLPSNTYLIQFDAKTFGSLVPANRQVASRWVRSSDIRGPDLSSYIVEAIGFAEDVGTEIILAIDLQDVIDSGYAAERLKEFQTLTKSKIEIDDTASLLSTVKGLTLGITIGNKPFGKIKVDFGRDTTILKDVARDMLIEVLGNQGLMIDDLKEWTAKVEGNQVTLEGYLSADGMRRVLSLVDAPAAKAVEDPSAGSQQSASDVDPKVAASQAYFQSITKILDDLRHRDSPQRIAQIGGWLEKDARKIDRLSMVNVDKDVLDYGQYVAQQLRNASAAIKGIGMRSRVRQVNTVAGGGPGYYGDNYDGGYYHGGVYYHGGLTLPSFNYTAGLQWEQKARTQIKTQEKVSGVAAARQIMTDVENATQQVRRAMVDRYNVDF